MTGSPDGMGDEERETVDSDYERRMASEQATYADCHNVHELPGIFHYWSNRYLKPKFEPFGFTDPDDFFRVYLLKLCRRPRIPGRGRPLRIISIGAGNGDMEVALARSLLDAGHEAFRLECLDINEHMLGRGRESAREHGVESHMDFRRGDFNDWEPEGRYDAVIANQCLHHVVKLERLFDRIKASLRPSGYLLVSDMIGRNGHQRWPEALEMVEALWEELPESKKYNHQLRRHEERYINHDCATEGFEGIRAQDILPLLKNRFHFRLFVPFANVIDVFVDRSFGHNFDAGDERDRAFIDRVHAADEEAMLKGRITPTHMVAALTRGWRGRTRRPNHLTPRRCVRPPDGRYGIRTRLSRWIAGMAVTCLLLLSGCGDGGNPDAQSPAEPRPNTLAEYLPIEPGYNVVVISFDALRADALGTYGYDRPTSPNIDAFAEESLVFERASVAGQATPSSFASAFTGELPFRVFRGWKLAHVPTMAAAFKDAGYTTAGIMNNVQLMTERHFDQGFDHYDMLDIPNDREVIERTKQWFEGRPDKPFLLWTHFISPHTPYTYR
ncbi:MAG TPA: methyltransferase domain-containing protein, partial [Chromatiales bacterium]|nr:methyltransferase domain-containing protein [Chromatiales bacterium]